MIRFLPLAALLLAGSCGSGSQGPTLDDSPQGASVQRAVADTEAAQREAATMRTMGPAPERNGTSAQTRRAAPDNKGTPSDAPDQGTN